MLDEWCFDQADERRVGRNRAESAVGLVHLLETLRSRSTISQQAIRFLNPHPPMRDLENLTWQKFQRSVEDPGLNVLTHKRFSFYSVLAGMQFHQVKEGD